MTGAEIVARVEAEGTQLTKWTTATIGRARMIQIELGIQLLCCRLEEQRAVTVSRSVSE